MSVAVPRPGRVDRQQKQREDQRRHDLGRLAQRAHQRAARQRADLRWTMRRVHAGCRPACTSSPASVLARRPPASGRSWRGRRRRARARAAAGARPRCRRSRARARRRPGCTRRRPGARPPRSAVPCVQSPSSPKRGSTSRSRSRSPGSAGVASTLGPADLGLERAGRALGHDHAVVDDPHAVGQAVGLLEVLGGEEDGHAVAARRGRSTSSHSARGAGSRPVVGSSRKRMRGGWTSASARSRRRFMPPE